jgi:hypothetical protein
VAFRGTEQVKWKDFVTDLNLTPAAFNPERVDSNAGLPWVARALQIRKAEVHLRRRALLGWHTAAPVSALRTAWPISCWSGTSGVPHLGRAHTQSRCSRVTCSRLH